MSDWVKEEGEKARQQKSAALDKQYLVSISNYWAVLRSQLEQDVRAINENAEWQDLFREQLKVENIEFGGLRIRKISFPGAFGIDITNAGDEIKVKSYYKLDNDHDFVDDEATLSVRVEHGHVVLRSRTGESFIVPEQAARHILGLAVRAKDDSRRFFDERPELHR